MEAGAGEPPSDTVRFDDDSHDYTQDDGQDVHRDWPTRYLSEEGQYESPPRRFERDASRTPERPRVTEPYSYDAQPESPEMELDVSTQFVPADRRRVDHQEKASIVPLCWFCRRSLCFFYFDPSFSNWPSTPAQGRPVGG